MGQALASGEWKCPKCLRICNCSFCRYVYSSMIVEGRRGRGKQRKEREAGRMDGPREQRRKGERGHRGGDLSRVKVFLFIDLLIFTYQGGREVSPLLEYPFSTEIILFLLLYSLMIDRCW